jgi:type IV pilus assembly protein PilA
MLQRVSAAKTATEAFKKRWHVACNAERLLNSGGNMKRQLQKGFTLIELMIVVAIIGILAAVALPAYQDYTKRARITEGFNLAAAAKTAVADYYSSNNEMPSINDSVGLPGSTTITGASVDRVGISNGVITIQFNTKVSTAATTLLLTPVTSSGSISWDCATGGTLESKLRPSNCRS